MLIKILLLVAVVLIAWFFLRSAPGSRGRAVRTLAVIFFGLIAAASIIFPEMLTAVAQALGVGRGTDLLLYGLVILVFAAMATSHRRGKAHEIQITRLARRLALDDAQPQFTAAIERHDAAQHADLGDGTGGSENAQ